MRRLSLLVVAASLAGLLPAAPVAAGVASPGADGAGDRYFPTHGAGGYDVRHYDLAVRYAPFNDRLAGVAVVTAVAKQRLSSFSLDLVGLTVARARVDGVLAAHAHTGRTLTLTPRAPVAGGAVFRVRVVYAGTPSNVHSAALGRSGWFHTSDGAAVAGEPSSSAFWFPSNDHPSDKARYDLAVTVPRGRQAISGGVEVGRPRTADGWTTFRWRMREPTASYLVPLAIGKFRIKRSTLPDGRPVLNAVDASLSKRYDRQLARTTDVTRFLVRRYGRYPFEAAGGIIDKVPFDYALETQTRPIYATDFFPRGRDGSWVVAHEMAHQWFGNSVTVKRWRDIWLNEGFATYAQWQWEARGYGGDAGRIARAWYRQYPAGHPFWDLRIGDPGPTRMFDGAVYARGAMTLAALGDRIGPPKLGRLLARWHRAHRHGWGTTRQFVALAESMHGAPLTAFFDRWLFSGQKPVWR